MNFYFRQPVDPIVRAYVQTIWHISQSEEEGTAVNPRMIPDGQYHMVINLGDPHRYADRNGVLTTPRRSHINAKQTEYVTIERVGQVEIMGVVFRMSGFYPFVRMPVYELAGEICNMEDVMDENFGLLEEQLAGITTPEGRCLVLEHWLRGRFHQTSYDPIAVRREIAHAAELMVKSNGLLRVHELADKLLLHERTLERQFKTYYGLSPKQYANVQRIHAVLRNMHANPGLMIDYAAAGNFYDQAHFTRMFKDLVGVTPKVYMQNRDLLSDLYNTSERQTGNMESN